MKKVIPKRKVDRKINISCYSTREHKARGWKIFNLKKFLPRVIRLKTTQPLKSTFTAKSKN